MIINRREMARAKLEKLKKGYSAFAETKELVDLIEKEIEKLEIPVYIDRTEHGCWFIPKKPNE